MLSFEFKDRTYFPRLIVTLALGVVVSGFLTWFMYVLIQSGDRNFDESKRVHIADFVRVKQAENTRVKQRVPERPKITEAPPTPDMASDDSTAEGQVISISGVTVEANLEIGNDFSFGGGDGEYFPIVKVAPIYPVQATSQKIEGTCLVEYTVTTTGSVKDVVVIESQCAHRYFHRPSVKAALKFKYKPRVIDGEAIEVKGIQNRFIYELVDE